MGSIKNYPGGKNGSGVYQNIINLIPKHKIYIEAFLGSGAILKNKKLAKYSICLDLNDKCLQNGRELNLSGCIYIKQDACSWLEQYLNICSTIKYIGEISFIYLDPPYPIQVRKWKKKIYKYEYDTRDHIKLLEVIGSTKVRIMISTYKNKMYDHYLNKWNTVDFPAVTRKGIVTETVYMNYEIPKILHDYRYIGKDFRERERNKGIVFRNVSKFKRMPGHLKNRIMEEMRKL